MKAKQCRKHRQGDAMMLLLTPVSVTKQLALLAGGEYILLGTTWMLDSTFE